MQVGVLLGADLGQRVALAEVHKLDAGLKKFNFLNVSKTLKPLYLNYQQKLVTWSWKITLEESFMNTHP